VKSATAGGKALEVGSGEWISLRGLVGSVRIVATVKRG